MIRLLAVTMCVLWLAPIAHAQSTDTDRPQTAAERAAERRRSRLAARRVQRPVTTRRRTTATITTPSPGDERARLIRRRKLGTTRPSQRAIRDRQTIIEERIQA